MTDDEGKPDSQNTVLRKELERFVVENDDLLELESRIGRFNIFDALGITNAEIRHSNFLAFLLDPAESHGQGQLFLKSILMDLLKQAPSELRPLSPIDLDGTDLRGVEIRREWKHIDLLIMCQQPRFFVVIENKIRSKEGLEQLGRYEQAMQEHYPDARPLYVYLTLDAAEASENKWMSYSYADIYRVFKRVRETCRKAIGEDVLVFLDHYLNLIGTRFMDNDDLDKLCQRIYKNHRQAIDLIFERVGNFASAILTEAKEALEEDPRWHLVSQKASSLHFLPKSWLEWLPPFAQKGDPKMWLFVRFLLNERKLGHNVELVPLKEVAKRKEIVEELLSGCSGFGFKRPQSKEVKNNSSRISAYEQILAWGEDGEPDPEEIQQAVKKTLDDLYPKLEKLATVLKPLCKRLASTT